MYLTLCIDAENRDEGVENHSEGTQQKTRPHSTEVRQKPAMAANGVCKITCKTGAKLHVKRVGID